MGATFILRLPVPITRAGPAAGSLRPPRPPWPARPRRARSRASGRLVVDDDRDALHLASVVLANAGATVRSALSAGEGLALLRRWRPHVLIFDIEMPGVDGDELIRQVRALPAEEGGRTPAVALTAHGRVEDRMRTRAAGFSMHVPEPVDPGELTTIVASLAGRA